VRKALKVNGLRFARVQKSDKERVRAKWNRSGNSSGIVRNTGETGGHKSQRDPSSRRRLQDDHPSSDGQMYCLGGRA